jgi:hypothetical protein
MANDVTMDHKLYENVLKIRNRIILDGAVTIATRLHPERSEIRILKGTRDFPLLRNFQAEPATHPATYLMDTMVFFPRVETAGA